LTANQWAATLLMPKDSVDKRINGVLQLFRHRGRTESRAIIASVVPGATLTISSDNFWCRLVDTNKSI
jgi:hypothetical protein